MSELNKFRSSIGGFHRGDVADYIERTALQHREAMQQAEAEIKSLRAAAAAAEAERDALRGILERLDAAYAEAREALKQPE